MKIVYRVLVAVVLLLSFVNAKESCILAFSTKKIHSYDKRLFIKRFPSGIVEKYNGYYEFKLESFPTYQEASRVLKKVKRYYKGAFIINCNTNKSTTISQKPLTIVKPVVKKIKKNSKTGTEAKDLPTIVFSNRFKRDVAPSPISLKEFDLILDSHHKSLKPPKISKVDNRPKILEPKILEPHEIPKSSKLDQSQTYDVLGFKRYVNSLFESSERVQEIFYQKKIDYILNEIKKDRYNFDVYASGYLRTGSSISAQSGNAPNINGDYTGAGVSLQANKLLYDGSYGLINHTYDILYKRLADINELNAKDRLLILGTSIYSNLYTSQEELRIFRKIYKKQAEVTKMIKEGYKQGKNSPLNLIDSKNDLLNIQKSILNLEYQYLNNDYVLRHSIKSRSKKPYKLYPEKIKTDLLSSLSLLQKEAIAHSSDIAKESNLLKLKQTDLLSQKRRYIPEVNFNSYVGYGLSTSEIFNLGNPGHGAYWELGLNFKLPIYNRNDIKLNEEKERLSILKQKATLSLKQRDVLIQVEKSYNEIMRTKMQIDIIEEQLSLLKHKLKIAKERFLGGVSPYGSYSDAVKGFLDYEVQLLGMKQRYIQEVSILNILIGKRDFYE